MSNKTKEQLFKVLVDLERELVSVQDAIKSTKENYTFDEDVNQDGLDKSVVKEVSAFAKRYVNESVDKVIEQGELFKNLQDELVG